MSLCCSTKARETESEGTWEGTYAELGSDLLDVFTLRLANSLRSELFDGVDRMIFRSLDETYRSSRSRTQNLAPLAVLLLQVRVILSERRTVATFGGTREESRVGVILLEGSPRTARCTRV